MNFNILKKSDLDHEIASITENYSDQILKSFKSEFKKKIEQGQIISKNKLLEYILNEFELLPYFDHFKSEIYIWHDKISHFSFLNSYLNHNEIREIIVHNHSSVQLEIDGSLIEKNINNLSANDYQMSLEYLVLKNGQKWNYSNPFVSFFISIDEQKYRASIIHYSTSLHNESKLFLRRINNEIFPISNFISNDKHKLIADLVKNKKNIIVAGATGSGKTALITTLLSQINAMKEHIIILEDTFEIQTSHDSFTRMITNENISENSLDKYYQYALRMRPDRITIGELRSSEIIPFILSMNTGHNGLLSSIHANSAVDAISKLVTLFMFYSSNKNIDYDLILKIICSNIDYIIFTKHKKISEIIQIIGSEKNTPFYESIYSKTDDYSQLN